MGHSHLHVSETKEEAAKQGASFIADELKKAYEARSRATFAISGGTTPKLLFAALAQAPLDWNKVHVFWVDERCVPPGDDQSNFKLANESWFVAAHFPTSNIHRIKGELTPDEAAIEYIGEIEKFFGIEQGQLPEIDVVHRGMGNDAHTASLFPGEPLIDNTTGIASAVWVEKMKSYRVTLLPGVLRKARTTVLQVAGADKAEPLRNVLQGPDDPKRFPCQIAARDSERAHWFLDKPAVAQLSE